MYHQQIPNSNSLMNKKKSIEKKCKIFSSFEVIRIKIGIKGKHGSGVQKNNFSMKSLRKHTYLQCTFLEMYPLYPSLMLYLRLLSKDSIEECFCNSINNLESIFSKLRSFDNVWLINLFFVSDLTKIQAKFKQCSAILVVSVGICKYKSHDLL